MQKTQFQRFKDLLNAPDDILLSDIQFVYKDKDGGLDLEFANDNYTWTVYYDGKWKDFSVLEDAWNEPFFDGKTLADLQKLDIFIY